MSDLIRIDRWSRPWVPSSESTLVETLNYHDMPILGVVRQGDAFFLFSCVAGQLEETHSWAYVSLSESDRSDLGDAATPEAIEQLTRQWLARSPITLALARDDAGVLSSTEIDRLEPANLKAGLRRLVADARAYLHRTDAQLEESLSILS